MISPLRAISSDGRALQSHCRGHWFDPSIAHHFFYASLRAHVYRVRYPGGCHDPSVAQQITACDGLDDRVREVVSPVDRRKCAGNSINANADILKIHKMSERGPDAFIDTFFGAENQFGMDQWLAGFLQSLYFFRSADHGEQGLVQRVSRFKVNAQCTEVLLTGNGCSSN